MIPNPEACLRKADDCESRSLLTIYNGDANNRLCCFSPHCVTQGTLPQAHTSRWGDGDSQSTGTPNSPALPVQSSARLPGKMLLAACTYTVCRARQNVFKRVSHKCRRDKVVCLWVFLPAAARGVWAMVSALVPLCMPPPHTLHHQPCWFGELRGPHSKHPGTGRPISHRHMPARAACLCKFKLKCKQGSQR